VRDLVEGYRVLCLETVLLALKDRIHNDINALAVLHHILLSADFLPPRVSHLLGSSSNNKNEFWLDDRFYEKFIDYDTKFPEPTT
jgi:hypothetical protein